MKKTIGMLLCLTLLLCGVGFAEEEATADDAITMQAICEANSFATLTAKYALVGVNIINYAADGTETDSQYFGYGQNGEILFENSNGYSEYFAGADRAYVFDPDTNQFSVRVFLDEAELASYKTSYQRMITYNEAETIVSSSAEEGLVTTQIALDETAAASYETALGLENVSALSFVYTLDPETLEISQCTASVVADGTQVTMSSVFFTYSADALTPPEFVNSLANPESSRTVTLVYNDVSTEYTIAAEALLRYTVPEGYEAYADANRTPLPDATENAGANETIYLLPIEMVDAESASAE